MIIEDDAALVNLVRIHLHQLPAHLMAFRSGREGLAWLAQHSADLCILDVMLPGMNGIDICQRIRQQDSFTPILMLTAKSEESDKVQGLEAGADDYLTKPFGVQEFTARVKALLRRAARHHTETNPLPETTVYTYKALTVDRSMRRVTLADKRIELTPKEFDLLALLVEHPGKTYSRKELLSLVWDYTFDGYEHTVTAHVNRLRTKIETDFSHPQYILTTWGIGYRFADVKSPEPL